MDQVISDVLQAVVKFCLMQVFYIRNKIIPRNEVRSRGLHIYIGLKVVQLDQRLFQHILVFFRMFGLRQQNKQVFQAAPGIDHGEVGIGYTQLLTPSVIDHAAEAADILSDIFQTLRCSVAG